MTARAKVVGGHPPTMEKGERVYVVSHGRLRGYSPLTRIMRTDRGKAWFEDAYEWPADSRVVFLDGGAP